MDADEMIIQAIAFCIFKISKTLVSKGEEKKKKKKEESPCFSLGEFSNDHCCNRCGWKRVM